MTHFENKDAISHEVTRFYYYWMRILIKTIWKERHFITGGQGFSWTLPISPRWLQFGPKPINLPKFPLSSKIQWREKAEIQTINCCFCVWCVTGSDAVSRYRRSSSICQDTSLLNWNWLLNTSFSWFINKITSMMMMLMRSKMTMIMSKTKPLITMMMMPFFYDVNGDDDDDGS